MKDIEEDKLNDSKVLLVLPFLSPSPVIHPSPPAESLTDN